MPAQVPLSIGDSLGMVNGRASISTELKLYEVHTDTYIRRDGTIEPVPTSLEVCFLYEQYTCRQCSYVLHPVLYGYPIEHTIMVRFH